MLLFVFIDAEEHVWKALVGQHTFHQAKRKSKILFLTCISWYPLRQTNTPEDMQYKMWLWLWLML